MTVFLIDSHKINNHFEHLHYIDQPQNITYISYKLIMQAKEKTKVLVSSFQLPVTPSPLEKASQIISECCITVQKTTFNNGQEKSQAMQNSDLSNNFEDFIGSSDKANLLLIQSRKKSTNLQNKLGSMQLRNSVGDGIPDAEQLLTGKNAQAQANNHKFLQFLPIIDSQEYLDTVYYEDNSNLQTSKANQSNNPQNNLPSVEDDNRRQQIAKKLQKNQFDKILGQSFQGLQFFSEESRLKGQNLEVQKRKTINIQGQKNQYASKISQLIKKCSSLKINSPIKIQISESDDQAQSSGNIYRTGDLIKSSIKSIHLAISEIKSPGFDQILEFDDQEKEEIHELIKDLQHLLNILYDCKNPKEQKEMNLVRILHKKYQEHIEEIKFSYHQKVYKMQEDLKKFMLELVENKGIFLSNSKIFSKWQNQAISAGKKQPNNCQIEANVLKQDFIKLKFQKQHLEDISQEDKNTIKHLEMQNRLLAKKYLQQVSQDKRQKTYFSQIAQKFQGQFKQFMKKTCNDPHFSRLHYQQFFREVSQRVFQISNSIPFEDNDQQNLFAPQNQNELFDMIERIRKFSLKVDSYYAEKDKEFYEFKVGMNKFMKRLFQTERISLKKSIEFIKSNKDLHLDFFKDFLITLKSKKMTAEEQREQQKRKENLSIQLNLQKVESFTFVNGQPQNKKQTE